MAVKARADRSRADDIRRTLSLANLDSLIMITRNEDGERERLLAEVSRAGRELVWRSSNEKRLFPGDAERAVVLASKRGLRSFILAFSVRAGFNLLLMLFRRFRRRKIHLRLILHAVFGPEPFRFAAMIGTFTLLNTLTLHLLRLSPPLSYIRRRLRAGLFAKTTFGPPEREGPEGERRWQAAAAGAVGSLGLLWETRARRTGVSQQYVFRKSHPPVSSLKKAGCLFEACRAHTINTRLNSASIFRMAIFSSSVWLVARSCTLG